jgi:DNA-binding response OmpR family regulator
MAERILLIEDDPRLAEMVSEYLGEAGFRVSIAAGGRAGLELFAREPFDALVLDLMLPDMDGLEVCRELRAKSEPVLMLTARGDATTGLSGWSWAPTTTCRSPSSRASCWRACARS